MRMAADDEIDIDEIRVVHDHGGAEVHLPFRHSTREYPEWPLARLAHTHESLARQVARTLMSIEPTDQAAIDGVYVGWTVPLDYHSVHDLLRELHQPPYDVVPKPSLHEVIQYHWQWLLALMMCIAVLAISLGIGVVRNRQLRHTKASPPLDVGGPAPHRRGPQRAGADVPRHLRERQRQHRAGGRDRRHHVWNSAAETTFGWSSEETIGQTGPLGPRARALP